jgi:hypothetical protein
MAATSRWLNARFAAPPPPGFDDPAGADGGDEGVKHVLRPVAGEDVRPVPVADVAGDEWVETEEPYARIFSFDCRVQAGLASDWLTHLLSSAT